MAKESISIQVKRDKEQETINEYEAFGWELLHSEDVTRPNSYGKETVHLTKLVFHREKTMPNYNQLVKLESQYRNTALPSITRIFVSLLTSIIFLYLAFRKIINVDNFENIMDAFTPSTIIFLLIGVGALGLGILFIKIRKKNLPIIKNILSKARNLCP